MSHFGSFDHVSYCKVDLDWDIVFLMKMKRLKRLKINFTHITNLNPERKEFSLTW